MIVFPSPLYYSSAIKEDIEFLKTIKGSVLLILLLFYYSLKTGLISLLTSTMLVLFSTFFDSDFSPNKIAYLILPTALSKRKPL